MINKILIGLLLLFTVGCVEKGPEVLNVADPGAVTIAPIYEEQVALPIEEEVPDLETVKLKTLYTSDGRNNLGNIRTSKHKWQGKVACSKPSAFECFEHPVWGVRAMARVLKTYFHKHNLTTVESIISRYAPPVENNTEKYVSWVSSQLNVAATVEINIDDDETLYRMLTAMIIMESGWEYDTADVVRAAIMLERKV